LSPFFSSSFVHIFVLVKQLSTTILTFLRKKIEAILQWFLFLSILYQTFSKKQNALKNKNRPVSNFYRDT